MRDQLTHRYFDTQQEIVKDVMTNDLGSLGAAVIALQVRLGDAKAGQTALDLDDADS